MRLYQEIIFLRQFALNKTKWVIENVKPYYDYLIKPNIVLGRHPFWCNLYIENIKIKDDRKHRKIKSYHSVYGFELENYKIKDKRKVLRNLVNPEIGKYILDQAMNIEVYKQMDLF
jgi:DNA (cytosine-5)-methyltransferase 1